MSTRAPAPTRATVSLTVSFGLVSIPIKAFKGTTESGISRSRYCKDTEGNYVKVKTKWVNPATGDELEFGQWDSLVETAGGPVELTDAECEQFITQEPSTAEVVAFLPLNLMANGHYVPQSMYQVKPDGNAKPFELLMQGMRKKGVFAIVRMVLKKGSSPQFAAILPNERMYVLHFDNEVREDKKRDKVEVDPAQLEAALALIDDLTESEAPDLLDDTSAKIMEYANDKAGGAPVVLADQGPDNVNTADDLMAALQASVKKDG